MAALQTFLNIKQYDGWWSVEKDFISAQWIIQTKFQNSIYFAKKLAIRKL